MAAFRTKSLDRTTVGWIPVIVARTRGGPTWGSHPGKIPKRPCAGVSGVKNDSSSHHR